MDLKKPKDDAKDKTDDVSEEVPELLLPWWVMEPMPCLGPRRLDEGEKIAW